MKENDYEKELNTDFNKNRKKLKKSKSISAFLVFTIILLIVILAVFIFRIITTNKDDIPNENTTTNTENISDEDINKLENISDNSDLTTNNENNGNNENIQFSQGSPIQLTLNSHIYTLNQMNASLTEDNSKSAIQINNSNNKYKIIYNTTDSSTYNQIKSEQDLKTTLQTKFNIQITSDIKNGTINNMDILICQISDTNGNGYFILTSLNSSEVAYAKIYNTEDSTKYIEDINNPLSDISKIITSVE